MLAYLDTLIAALLRRDPQDIRRQLAHPLARALPRAVRAEAMGIARAGPNSLRAPVRTLHFQHQTTHLLGGHRERPETARRETSARPRAQRQLELPLRAIAAAG